MEKLPQPKTCCKCNLRTGVILICMTQIALSSYLILEYSVLLSRLSKEKDVVQTIEVKKLVPAVPSEDERLEDGSPENQTETVSVITIPVKKSRATEYTALVFGLLSALILGVGFNTLYLFGVEKENAGYMKPSLVANALSLVIYTLWNLIFTFAGHLGVIGVFAWLIGEGLGIYFFLVLHSYYQQLTQGLLQPESMIMPQGAPQQVMMAPGQKVAESSFISQQPQQPQYQAVMAPDGQQMVMAQQPVPSMYDPAMQQQLPQTMAVAPAPLPGQPGATGSLNPFLN